MEKNTEKMLLLSKGDHRLKTSVSSVLFVEEDEKGDKGQEGL